LKKSSPVTTFFAGVGGLGEAELREPEEEEGCSAAKEDPDDELERPPEEDERPPHPPMPRGGAAPNRPDEGSLTDRLGCALVPGCGGEEEDQAEDDEAAGGGASLALPQLSLQEEEEDDDEEDERPEPPPPNFRRMRSLASSRMRVCLATYCSLVSPVSAAGPSRSSPGIPGHSPGETAPPDTGDGPLSEPASLLSQELTAPLLPWLLVERGKRLGLLSPQSSQSSPALLHTKEMSE
jgi:hypothetical protein